MPLINCAHFLNTLPLKNCHLKKDNKINKSTSDTKSTLPYLFIESNSAAFQPTITLYQNEFITIFDTVYFAKAINI